MRLEGGHLAAHLHDQLPDYEFAFEGGRGGGASRQGFGAGGTEGEGAGRGVAHMLLPAPPHTTRHPATPTAGHHRAQLQRQERVRQAGALRYAVHAVLSCGASTGPSPTLSPAPPSPPHTQVALIVYLAHVGSFVPATSARVGMCDRIFTRLTPSRSEPAGVSA